jgi:signal transduction histidine kinase/ActR/RegA family two-component response regulator
MRFLKPDKHLLGCLAILAAAACLIALTWLGTSRAVDRQRAEASDRIMATVANQALTFSEQVNRQILAVDQTLRILVRAWETDPRRFDLEAWRHQAAVLSGISRDMLLVDENGIIRQSSVPEAIGQNVSDQPFFTDAAQHAGEADHLFIGSAAIGQIMRLWHLDVARTLHRPDGSFAGVIDADYRISAITDVFSQTDLGAGAFVTVVGLQDGKLRAAVGPATIDPDVSIADTPMFRAIRGADNGVWIGPSATDSVIRVHAFRRLPDRDLVVVVGEDQQEALAPANAWRMEAYFFAGCISLLLLIMAGILIRGVRQAHKRELRLAEDRAMFAAANAQLEVARARADAKTEQLEATLAGMTDGVAMVDAHMCLVEWNARFPEIAGIPADILRVGQPMEEILRAQARGGQFGAVDVEAEVQRRIAALRSGRVGTTIRERPDGRTLELRRNRLPDGGFVTLYSDVTDRQRAEDALREARGIAEAANAAKSRFVAVVSHEIRTPLNALLNTLRLLADSSLAPAQASLVAMARQSGDALFGLINDVLEMSRMEAGQLTLRPSRFALRPLLESCVEMFRAQAAERGIAFDLQFAPRTPTELLTDPGRLRQVLLNLLSNAVKFAAPGPVVLAAVPIGTTGVRLTVRDSGPVIPEADRQRLFRPFSRLERPEGDDPIGTGLGLAICRHLVSLMGGEIGCEPQTSADGRTGNGFWVDLPQVGLPEPLTSGEPDADLPAGELRLGRRLPRTRILLVDDVVANQVVTATLLRREGHHVDVASSGAAAIAIVGSKPYDLVFMDSFMPGMSGQEATQHIRSLTGPASRVPIIALTANVSSGDESAFRAAGMDGLLGKPVSLPELLDTIGRHVWHTEPDALPEPPVAVTGAHGEATPLLATDRVTELRDNLPAEMLNTLIDECLTDLENRLPALRRALNTGALAAISAQAHAMVGMAAGYGMAALESTLRSIMDAAREGQVQSDLAAVVEDELNRSAAALRKALQKELA